MNQLSDPDKNIAFVGGGNMASAIIQGLILQGHRRDKILVCAPSSETRTKLIDTYHVRATPYNDEAVAFADVILIAVKPQFVAEVCQELRAAMDEVMKNPLVISLAAGISRRVLMDNLGAESRVVCAMPNLPSAVCKGLTGMYMPADSPTSDIAMAENVMQAIGETVWVDDEAKMPAIVAAAGSSPAYFFLFMEAMEKASIEQGLPADTAKITILQSALGAVSMAIRSDESLAVLRAKVTSPQGTTEKAIQTLQNAEVEVAIYEAMNAAAQRVFELYRNHSE